MNIIHIGGRCPPYIIVHGVLEHWKNRNSKSQITNIKQITMTKIQNSKPVLVIEYWNLRFVWNLVLGI